MKTYKDLLNELCKMSGEELNNPILVHFPFKEDNQFVQVDSFSVSNCQNPLIKDQFVLDIF